MRKTISKTDAMDMMNSPHYHIVETTPTKRILQDSLGETNLIITYSNGQVSECIFESEFV